mmetsp:Transcript_30772/g.51145  ORF Transcript_30772/g.51145 Transcript_30772/m.51145 type:complete len:209 (+) Transcript_30772:104-730(+)
MTKIFGHNILLRRTPVLAPGIADNPVDFASFWICLPSNYAHDMIYHHMPQLGIFDTTTGIFDQRLRVDAGGDWSTSQDFTLQLVHNTGRVSQNTVRSVFGNGGVGHNINLGAFSSHSTKSVTSLARVFRRAAGIHMLTEPFGTLRRAGQIRLARIVRNITLFGNEFKDTRMTTTMTTSSLMGGTVQNVLNREIDFVSCRIASNLDPIS